MKKNRLTAYLTAGVAAAAAGQADAATIVTLYGPGAQNPSSPGFDPPVPAGIDFGVDFGGDFFIDRTFSADSYFAYDGPSNAYFTRGTDLANITAGLNRGYYAYDNGTIYFYYGAIAGAENYANISFNGDDDTYEAVGQFFFDGAGGGYLIALAVNDDDTALSISDGKAAIDAIPEPTSLGLLAMGAAGLAMLRRKKKAS